MGVSILHGDSHEGSTVMTSTGSPAAIDGHRFWSTVMRSGEIGPGKAGGLCRLALSDAEKAMLAGATKKATSMHILTPGRAGAIRGHGNKVRSVPGVP